MVGLTGYRPDLSFLSELALEIFHLPVSAFERLNPGVDALSVLAPPTTVAVPDPKFAINPLTEVVNQFSITLGLTEQQRQQVIPILKEELKQLEALKKDASLSAVRKVKRVREIGNSIDERSTPLINPEQQQKFQALREQMRRHMIEEMASQIAQKVEAAAEKKL